MHRRSRCANALRRRGRASSRTPASTGSAARRRPRRPSVHDELMAIPEGGQTLFDNTLVVHWSELSQGDTHQKDKDLVIFATGNSGVFSTGRFLDFNAAPKRGFSNMLLNCWQFMGYGNVTSWGDPLLMPRRPGPLAGLTGA